MTTTERTEYGVMCADGNEHFSTAVNIPLLRRDTFRQARQMAADMDADPYLTHHGDCKPHTIARHTITTVTTDWEPVAQDDTA